MRTTRKQVEYYLSNLNASIEKETGINPNLGYSAWSPGDGWTRYQLTADYAVAPSATSCDWATSIACWLACVNCGPLSATYYPSSRKPSLARLSRALSPGSEEAD